MTPAANVPVTGRGRGPGDLLDDLRVLATRIATEAAELLVERLSQTRSEVSTKTSRTDMVTEMDRTSEALLVERILAARPDDAILGEEGAKVHGTSGVRWVVDPIDGTTNYLYGHPGFSVSVAAELDGEAVVGIVVDPLHADVFSAVRGRGATRNGERIRVSARSELATALVATGFAYDASRRQRQAAVVAALIGRVRDIRRMGAASVDLCSVACGRVDAYYEKGLGPWDLAAGVLIASEAGASTGDLDGGPPSGGFVLAAAPGLFDELRGVLRAARVDEA